MELELPEGHVSYYTVLSLSRECTVSDIRQAYHRKLLAVHPDKQKSTQSNAGAQVETIQTAYKTLIENREQYDEALDHQLVKMGLGPDLASGLEAVSLDDFTEIERGDGVVWVRDCPRCTSKESFEVSEDDLVSNIENCGRSSEDDGAYTLVIQCSSCSLWLRVKYYDLEESD